MHTTKDDFFSQSIIRLQEYTEELSIIFSKILEELNGIEEHLSINSDKADQDNLLTHLIDVQEKERQKLANDLHNDVGQMMYSILLRIKMMKNLDMDGKMTDHLMKIEDITEIALGKVKSVSLSLFPLMLDDIGLIASLKSFVYNLNENYPTKLNFSAKASEANFSKELQICIYRIYHQLLSYFVINVGAKEISVNISTLGATTIDVVIIHDKTIDKLDVEEELALIGKIVERCNGSLQHEQEEGEVVKVKLTFN